MSRKGVERVEAADVGVVVRMPKGVGSGIGVVALAMPGPGRRSFLMLGEAAERMDSWRKCWL